MAKQAVALSGVRSVGRPPKEPAYAPIDRIRKMVAEEMLDGRWGSWLGIQRLQGRVSTEQWNAALQFAEAAEARERALASPGCNPRAQDLSAVRGRSLKPETDRVIKRHREAMEAWERLESGLSKLQLHALDVIVVQMRPAEGFVQQMALRSGLDRLVALGKTTRRKR